MTSAITHPRPSPAAAAALLLAALAAGCHPPATEPSGNTPLSVDGQAAVEMARQLCELGPRPAGSPGAARAAEWLAAACRRARCEPTVDTWTENTDAGRMTFRNVTATVPGRGRRFIVLASHYDTKRLADAPDFQGANDGASSTTLLLVLMRRLRAAPWRGPDLRFVFFDGEECVRAYNEKDGLRGSRRLAARLAADDEIRACRAMILLDMIGDSDLRVTFSPDDNRALIRQVFRLADAQGVRGHFGIFTDGVILDDHTPFLDRGVPAIDFIDFNYGPGNSYWHTANDTLDKISAKSLAIVGNVVLQLLTELAAE